MPRKLRVQCFAAFHLLACAFQASANEWATHPYHGVTYIVRSDLAPRPVTMHIVLIDLSAPGIRFKVTPPGGTLETIRQSTADFLNQESAQVAINAHFFLPFPSDDPDANVVGFAASEGTVYSPFEPQPIGPDYVDQSYAIISYAPALNIDPSNAASIIHRDPEYADNTHVLEPVPVWNAVSGSAQIVSNGVKVIPSYSGPPDGLNPFNFYSDANSWYSYPRSRTAIGVTSNSEQLVLFTVDEAGGSEGLTPGEVADLLIQDYHVTDALNLDGGGSTSLALQNPATGLGRIVNTSSDNPAGRATGSNLAVFAQPDSDLPWLSARVASGSSGLIISWRAPAPGWRLQENRGLAPADWTDVRAPVHSKDDRLEVKVSSQEPAKFYRLIKD
jgi:hypothetical protein